MDDISARNLIELFVNTVLYHRHIYPDGIFRKRRAYSTDCQIIIFPPLLAYIKKVLTACLFLINRRSLDVLEIVFVSNKEVIETHALRISQLLPTTDNEENELEVEEQIKELLLRLQNKLQVLARLPEDTTFHLNVHTTNGSFRQINNGEFQEFMWTKVENSIDKNLLCMLPVYNGIGVDISVNQKPNHIAT